MGMDANALIVVGRNPDDLEMRDSSLYDKFMAAYGEEDDWSSFIGDFCYLESTNDERLEKLRFVRTYVDNDDGYVGFVVADSGSWGTESLDLEKLTIDLSYYYGLFAELFGAKPKIFLMPRVW